MRHLAFLLALLTASAASARIVLPVATQESDVHIQIESCFDPLPSSGYAPVEVTINNSSGQARTWDLKFGSPLWGYYGAPLISERVFYDVSVTVESGAARTFRLLVPLTTSASQQSGLGVILSGYGLPNGGRQMFPGASPTGRPMTPCMALSEGAAPEFESRLERAANSNSQQFHAVKCKADELPEEWRAFSGFAGIWLLESEWNALAAAQRTALEDWVAIGGRLFLYTKASPAAPPRRMGLGSIVSMDRETLEYGQARLQAILRSAHVTTGKAAPANAAQGPWGEMPRADIMGLINDDRAHWAAAEEIGVLQPNLPLLVSFLAVFAMLVGPLNLFVFAREGRRSRLFWTVPLISFAATVLLLVLIIVQDGLGGWGIRSVLICLVPSSRKAVVVQEQISRTGVLGSTAFFLRDPAWMTMVNLTGSTTYREIRSVRNSDARYSGEWFKSRAVQAQWIESVLPTRAEVTLVNPDEARDGRGAPAVISSIASPLSNLWFWDSKGRLWGAANVRTGVRTVLSPGTVSKALLADARIALRRRMAGEAGVAGNFVALSGDSAAFIKTLPSIRWKDRQAIYVGPVTGAELHGMGAGGGQGETRVGGVPGKGEPPK